MLILVSFFYNSVMSLSHFICLFFYNMAIFLFPVTNQTRTYLGFLQRQHF